MKWFLQKQIINTVCARSVLLSCMLIRQVCWKPTRPAHFLPSPAPSIAIMLHARLALLLPFASAIEFDKCARASSAWAGLDQASSATRAAARRRCAES